MSISPNKAQKIAQFDVNGVGTANAQLFGLPFNYEESNIVIIPVPWEVTVSYQAGTAQAAQAILQASPQLDLYDFDAPKAWQEGFYLQEIPTPIQQLNEQLRPKAASYIDFLENGGDITTNSNMQQIQNMINEACEEVKNWVKQASLKALKDGKKVGILGGEHSVPLGYIEALAEQHSNFGILQIDAHADLRPAYEGFTYSHASIFYNVLPLKSVSKLVSVGVRDICEAEVRLIEQSKGRIVAFYDHQIKEESILKRSKTWDELCTEIVAHLPQKVYISFDIDGLDPKLCPHTGTPVAGGLQLYESFHLIKKVIQSGRQIIGFDLCEVAPNPINPQDEWDANVGARVLYKLCCLMAQ